MYDKDYYDYSNTSIVMATRNEEKAVEKVIKDIKRVTKNHAEIIIVDGSDDGTPEIANNLGIKVIRQKPQGYGRALKLALRSATKDIIITIDCDDTYPIDNIPKFIKLSKDYDIVSGSRLLDNNKMATINRIGNQFFAHIASILYGVRVTDVTTGMRAYRKFVIDNIDWTENIGLSAELLLRPILRKYKIIEIPINYRYRIGKSKLNPITGGISIFKSILKYAIVRK